MVHLLFALISPDSTLDKQIYPLAKPLPAPVISVDVSKAPDLADWADKAKKLATDWYPHLTELLSTQSFASPHALRFVFREKQDAPAYTSGHEISFSIPYVRGHQNDLGMVIHELTHVVQGYPRNATDTGWLVEGIADYIRWWRYEPETPRSRINFMKATYHDAYRTTASWLAYVSQKYDRRLVPTLDGLLRKGEDPMPTFMSLTGKSADDLWTEFKDSKWATPFK